MTFDLELDKAVKEIKKSKAKLVLIQLPDGLKPQATIITDYLEKNTKAKILIWSDSCYGACDVPNIKIDLIIQFGHNELQPKL
jgi:2-(3-amino-3-carboxypropyl)histidine synthase